MKFRIGVIGAGGHGAVQKDRPREPSPQASWASVATGNLKRLR